jgi:uncharacterized protein YcbK (DUF882 family)
LNDLGEPAASPGPDVESGEEPLQDMQRKWPGLRTLRYGLLLAVSVATLSGCVSAVSNDMRADSKAAQESEETVAEGSAEDTPVTADGSVAEGSGAAASGTEEAFSQSAGGQQATDLQPGGEAGQDRAGLVMQPTTLNAGATSIYSTGQAGAAGTGDAVQASRTNASVNSIYSGGTQDAAAAGRLPVEDMAPVGTSTQQPVATLGDEEASALPERVPIPKTARTALFAESATANAADMALAAPVDGAAVGESQNGGAEAFQPRETESRGTQPRKTMTLASLFAGKREAKEQFDGDRFAQQPRRVLNRDSAGVTHKASLGTLPGVSSSLFSTSHSEADEVEDDAPQFKEVASLAGLARLAPNGLWLQTEKVKTGCFKPELLKVLKSIEQHYDKPIIVTSGLRDLKRNRAKQSLHTVCAAADIQIAGVSKWELAEYLRSMPGRGGVGTYCHTESVHIDVGPERDWNWRCRRKK